jgi:LDH2 family malate/lactate/ureidoglycolate dehydrogenase
MNVDARLVCEQIMAILRAWGMDGDIAAMTANLMTETDLLGVDSHGVSMLMMYETLYRNGQLNLKPDIRTLRETPCTALIDGDAGLGHPAAAAAMNLAVDKALAVGIGMVGVRNSHHFGAAGVYARLASKRGAIGFVFSSTRFITMVPTNGAVPVLGTNPLAFTAPAKRNNPFSLDMATTTAAVNKVKVYDLNERPLPPGWVIDGQGQSVTDAGAAMSFLFEREEGGLTPLGGDELTAGHKGYGLAMLVHILGGVLTGASFSPLYNLTRQKSDGDNIGHLCLAIDPSVFRNEGDFESDLDDIIDLLHATPSVHPDKPVLVAGDPEAVTYQQRSKDGIPIPLKLDRHIRDICERCSAPYLLRAAESPEHETADGSAGGRN